MEVVSHNATLPVAFSVIDGVNERRDPVRHATFFEFSILALGL
jgi:hypothetical protein